MSYYLEHHGAGVFEQDWLVRVVDGQARILATRILPSILWLHWDRELEAERKQIDGTEITPEEAAMILFSCREIA